MKKYLFSLSLLVALSASAFTIPPKPDRYFNDTTGTFSQPDALALNEQLAQFERDNGVQVVAYIDSKLPEDTVLEDYTLQLARAWKVGSSNENTGVVLFVFKDSRKLRIEVGYGMEGGTKTLLIPDAIANRIVQNDIIPHFKAGDYKGGIQAGINSILSAAKGEYAGTGKTIAESQGSEASSGFVWFLIIVGGIVLVLIVIGMASDSFKETYVSGSGLSDVIIPAAAYSVGRSSSTRKRSSGGSSYTGSSYSRPKSSYTPSYSPSPSPSSSSSSSSSSFGGGFSGFSGGGGSFGGGGASGGW